MEEWDRVIAECSSCTKCKLHMTRTRMVFGEGNPDADIIFVGEAPGADEDVSGRPFVGKAGQLLDLVLKAQRIKREECFIGNICKCRPENNRVPYEDEAAACLPYLMKQIELINPKIIVCLGATPLKYLVDKNAQITKVRGQWAEKGKYLIMPTYHPAALLRDPGKKIPFWEDIKKARERLRK